MTTNMLSTQLKAQIKAVLGSHLDLGQFQVFLFGSRVRGDASERSDIDIGIQGEHPLPGHLKIEIEHQLEQLQTLLKFDVVDFSKSSNSFKKQALNHVEYL